MHGTRPAAPSRALTRDGHGAPVPVHLDRQVDGESRILTRRTHHGKWPQHRQFAATGALIAIHYPLAAIIQSSLHTHVQARPMSTVKPWRCAPLPGGQAELGAETHPSLLKHPAIDHPSISPGTHRRDDDASAPPSPATWALIAIHYPPEARHQVNPPGPPTAGPRRVVVLPDAHGMKSACGYTTVQVTQTGAARARGSKSDIQSHR